MSTRRKKYVTAAARDGGGVLYKRQLDELEKDSLEATLKERKQVLNQLFAGMSGSAVGRSAIITSMMTRVKKQMSSQAGLMDLTEISGLRSHQISKHLLDLTLEGWAQREEELNKSIKKTQDLIFKFEEFLETELDKVFQKVERAEEERLRQEATIKELQDQHAELTERKEELQREEQRLSLYSDYMKQWCQSTQFKDAEALSNHLQNLLYFQDKLYQSQVQRQEQVDQMKKELLGLEDKHNFLRLQKNNELSRLQDELEKNRSESLIWEMKWGVIQETATKKTLMLGRIKMATLSLYEMTNSIDGEGDVDMNDTEKQLEHIKTFDKEHTEIVKKTSRKSSKAQSFDLKQR
ncbi:coiled-coil domain-containing protein 42 like-2-like [Embiotoca jacksoni]|uniref:coiled-coil domain-containing protein 42 like-2-like n=1 Tax=Embiotoca jacksoni TaxID=100190 RepID=UPI0037048650